MQNLAREAAIDLNLALLLKYVVKIESKFTLHKLLSFVLGFLYLLNACVLLAKNIYAGVPLRKSMKINCQNYSLSYNPSIIHATVTYERVCWHLNLTLRIYLE